MRRRRTREAGKLGLFERLLFSVMGPPQLGSAHRPGGPGPQRPVERCPRCGQPYDGHEVVRDPGLTWTRCPAPSPQPQL